MTLASSSCIQLGIFLDFDRLIVPVKRERREAVPTRMNKAQLAQFDAVRTRRAIIRLALCYPDHVIAAFVDRSPHQVYVIRKRSGLKKYRTDHYVRAPRAKKEAIHQLKKAA